jgi:small GTP-binding protein
MASTKGGKVITLGKKVCMVGDVAVGKSSLVRRFIYDLFEDRYVGTNGTTGVKVSCKVVTVPRNDTMIELTIMLWDLADSKDCDSVRVSYLRGAGGAVAVCDITRPSTLDGLYKYNRDLRAINPEAHLVLAFNKIDLADQRVVTDAQIENIALEINAPYYLTSGRTGENVDHVFRHLGRLLVTDAEHELLTGRPCCPRSR